MDNQININNNNLANYVMFKLDKLENSFTEQELNQIKEMVIDYKEENEDSYISLEELLKFKKLESLTLRNGYIYNDNYEILLALVCLNSLTFENCEFENADLISSLKLKSLSLINCKIESYLFISLLNNLNELTIIKGKVEISKINLLKDLKYLQLSYSRILDNTALTLNNLEELYLDNTNITDFSFLNNLANLQKISIDENQYNNNKVFFDKLVKNNILVLNEGMTEFGGDINEL